MKSQPDTFYYPFFVRMLGDVVSGVMLSRIAFWFTNNKQGQSKLRVTFDGKYWLVKSREDWKRECGITRHQYDRAIALLKVKGFIYTEIHLFNNKTSVFLRPNHEKLRKAILKQNIAEEKADYRESENRTTGNPKTGLPEVLKPDSPITGLLQEYNKGTALPPHKAGKSKTGSGGSMLAKDVMVQHTEKAKQVVPLALEEGKKGPEGLRREWVTLVPYFHDVGHTMLPLTKKEGGMLSAFRKRVGVERAPDLLLWAVREWTGRFAHQVLELHHTALPNQPHPAYLLKYADAALSGWSAGLTQKAIAPVQSIATQIVVKKFVVK